MAGDTSQNSSLRSASAIAASMASSCTTLAAHLFHHKQPCRLPGRLLTLFSAMLALSSISFRLSPILRLFHPICTAGKLHAEPAGVSCKTVQLFRNPPETFLQLLTSFKAAQDNELVAGYPAEGFIKAPAFPGCSRPSTLKSGPRFHSRTHHLCI